MGKIPPFSDVLFCLVKGGLEWWWNVPQVHEFSTRFSESYCYLFPIRYDACAVSAARSQQLALPGRDEEDDAGSPNPDCRTETRLWKQTLRCRLLRSSINRRRGFPIICQPFWICNIKTSSRGQGLRWFSFNRSMHGTLCLRLWNACKVNVRWYLGWLFL